jgi:hypothetical protein
MTTEEIIKTFTTDGEFNWGIDTVMKSLCPNCLYSLEVNNGEFKISSWENNQWSDVTQSFINPPTSQQIREEYLRQNTISEVLKYIKQGEKNGTLC